MSKYENYIYMEICTITLDAFKRSVYNTHQGYCRGLLRSLRENDLSKREKYDLSEIFAHLDLIFGMDEKETSGYILGYLESERYDEFERVIRLTKDLFPFTGG